MAGNKSGHCEGHNSPVASGGGGGGGDNGDLDRKEKREMAVNFPWK